MIGNIDRGKVKKMARVCRVKDILFHTLHMVMEHKTASRTAYITYLPNSASLHIAFLSENKKIPLLEREVADD